LIDEFGGLMPVVLDAPDDASSGFGKYERPAWQRDRRFTSKNKGEK
jgi:hypothetical protein